MTALVLDCSLAMAWVLPGEASPEIANPLAMVAASGAIVPALWFWEVGNVMAMAVKRQRLTDQQARNQLTYLAQLPIACEDSGHDHAFGAVFELAGQQGLTVYDAAYLELALRRGLPLATLDQQLAATAARLSVPTIPQLG